MINEPISHFQSNEKLEGQRLKNEYLQKYGLTHWSGPFSPETVLAFSQLDPLSYIDPITGKRHPY
jgi:hypothetical protein